MKSNQNTTKMKKIVLINLLAIIVLIGCKKDDTELTNPSIYITGTAIDNVTQKAFATLWKNGVATTLTNGERFATAADITISNSDIYIAGLEWDENHDAIPKIWKNGEELYTLYKTYIPFAIAVIGSDVYVAGGWQSDLGTKVWKNGIEIIYLETLYGKSMVVNGNDIYLTGYEYDYDKSMYIAKVFKNGTVLYTLNETPIKAVNTHTWELAIYDNNIYVAGYEINNNGNAVAKVWKNGILLYTLSDGTKYEVAQSLSISGNDVYVAGYEGDYVNSSTAKVWKNGKTLYNLTDGAGDAHVCNISIVGNDVYVAGKENIRTGKVWKNRKVLYNLNSPNFSYAHVYSMKIVL